VPETAQALASNREKQQAKEQHGAPAVSVGERPIGNGAECKTSHEEAERELRHSRTYVQGMSDGPERHDQAISPFALGPGSGNPRASIQAMG
jgi:hypothetical protein